MYFSQIVLVSERAAKCKCINLMNSKYFFAVHGEKSLKIK